ncbi:MAG: hypothetical protein K0R20_2398, partial [Actinomycetia bacterium]|nr:hypothetical protein [Actinomycetes bacterium]
ERPGRDVVEVDVATVEFRRGRCRRSRDRGGPVRPSDVDLARAGPAGRGCRRSAVRRSVSVGLSRGSLLSWRLLRRCLLCGAGASSEGASSTGASSTGTVPSPVLPSESVSPAATGSVLTSSASAFSELCPSANANRSTNETNEASPRLVRRRLCREFVLVPILHPPTGVCATSLPYGPGRRPTAYTVVLLPRNVTPPSGGHIGRTALPLRADGVVRSEERDRGNGSLLREAETFERPAEGSGEPDRPGPTTGSRLSVTRCRSREACGTLRAAGAIPPR